MKATSCARRRVLVADVLLALALGVLAAFLGWLRLTPLVRRTLWAEDAGLFLQDRVLDGPVVTWLRPYDGYLHLLPRVLTDLVVALTPDRFQGLGVTAASLAVVGGAATVVYLVTADAVVSRLTRAALALVPVVTPMAALEALGNTANVHWFLLFTVPFVLVWRPGTRVTRVLRALLLVVVVLSEVQALLFVPVVAVLAWRRGRSELLGAGAFGAAVVAQVVAVATSPRVRGDADPVRPLNVLLGFVAEPVMGSYASPGRTADLLLSEQGVLVAVAATLPFVLAAALALAEPGRRRALLTLAVVYGALVVWVADLVLNPTVVHDFAGQGMGVTKDTGYARYALVPSMFLLATAVLALDRVLARRRWWATVLAVLALVGLAVVVARQFEPYTWTRAAGPDWSESWSGAEATCATDPSVTLKVPSAPTGWGLLIRCEDLLGSGLDG